MTTKTDRKVTFIQSGAPKLKAGEYTLTVTQAVTAKNTKQASDDKTTGTPSAHFSSSKVFAVKGERFTFTPDEVYGVFPPKELTGEYAGVLPQVVLNKLTLPWERSSESADGSLTEDTASHTPWLAVLLFNADEAPPTPPGDEGKHLNEAWPRVQKVTAQELVKDGTDITVWGASATGKGAMPANYLAYPGLEKLDFAESPEDICNIIDVPIGVFNQIAPSIEDLYYLGHIRAVDTLDSEDNPIDTQKYAVVVGNRLPKVGNPSYAYLVSLEKMSDYLPSSDGTPSSKIPAGTEYVRLITYVNWSFTANDADQSFKTLLENVNQMAGDSGSSGLRLPMISQPANGTSAASQPSAGQVNAALAEQANGSLTKESASVLVNNALNMGYVPFEHQLRHGGHTVSWYRGPFATYKAQTTIAVPISCADAANRFNPQTGLFDVSYGAAWQLGRLLALQNRRFALALYNWKKDVLDSQVRAQEVTLLNAKMQGSGALTSFIQTSAEHPAAQPPPIPDYVAYWLGWKKGVLDSQVRAQEVTLLNAKMQGSGALTSFIQTSAEHPAAQPPPIPDYVAYWLGRLRLLYGLPINYLVPNEQMLPPEALRFFYLDQSWVDALLDGALSIGRASTAEHLADTQHAAHIGPLAQKAALVHRPQRKPPQSTYVNTDEVVTGFLLRSQVVSGWPRLNVNGYNSPEGDPVDEIPKLRMERMGKDLLLCLFDGEVKMVAIHEAPEALHCGVETAAPEDKCAANVDYVTTLRKLSPPDPGKQYLEGSTGESPNACVPTRSDGQTLHVVGAVANMTKKLAGADFTSAEFALEMVKGVSKVEYYNPPPLISTQWQDVKVNGQPITQDYAALLAQKRQAEAQNQVAIN